MAEPATDLREAPARAAVPAAAPAPQAAPTPAASTAPTPPPSPPKPSGTFIIVRDRYTIYCDRPIPYLDMPNATAYEVTDRKQEGRPLYALVVKPEMPPRISAMRVLKGLEIAHLLHLVDWGVAEWPPAERKCVIVIYHRPMGGRVMDTLVANFRRTPDHLFAKNIIKPLTEALNELALKGITHRAIRPDNIYYMDEARTNIVLGDCLTSTPAHDQPVSVETIESGLAMPSGRGAGNFHDDLYAFGATLLMLSLGRDTLQGVPDEEILRRKITHGSYATLVGDERPPVTVLECLRGLLADDPEQRWKTENIELWLAGKRLTPIQAKAENQARRAVRVGDQEFTSIRPLSYALYTNWEKATALISDGSLEIWLRRQFEYNDMADAVAAAIKNAHAMPGAQKGEADDVLISRVLMILDPRAPVRLRGFRVNLDGFGTALAIAMLRKEKLTAFTDFINKDLWRHAIAAQPKPGPEHQQFEQNFRDLKNYLKDASMGAGIERCVYELNEWQFCMSPMIAEQYVLEVKGILPALDAAAKNVNTKMWPIDRHIASFLRARYAKGTSVQLDSMNDARPERSTIGMLSVLAIVQWRLGPEALFGLASWVGGLMGPVINSYQNRNKRRELEKEIPKFVRKGNLAELYNYLDNPQERQKDAEGFAWARTEFAAADKQIYELEHGQFDRQEAAEKTGRQAGAVCAAIMMALIFAGCVMIQLV
jgi:hypothetical protein